MLNSIGPLPGARADDFRLPAPGVMVPLSPEFNPPILKGIKVHPDNPFRFDFILDQGDSLSLIKEGDRGSLKQQATRLIKYFLASLTIPEDDLWVNLSPYEKDRIIPRSFGLTEMGRDLLAEDYMLKEITASLIYPEDKIGKKFWKRIYDEAAKRFGTTNVPVNTFNKVWIVPEKAVVYENVKSGTAYVVESKLKVMLEQDYLALQKNSNALPLASRNDISSIGANIIREIVIPELTKEVNEDKNFAQLRQVYNSLILATWYKKKIRDSILEQVYADKKKVAGVNIDDPQETQRIYQRYLQAFKKGVYNYIKEEIDPVTQETWPRKYFSGGVRFQFQADQAMTIIETFKGALNLIPGQFLQISAQLNASIGSTGLSLKKALSGRGLFQEVQSVIDDISGAETDYIKSIQALGHLQSGDNLRTPVLMDHLWAAYLRLLKKTGPYTSSRALKGTGAGKIFESYAQELKDIHQKLTDILTLYADLNWPGSAQWREKQKEVHARAEAVWEAWAKKSQYSTLVRLKNQQTSSYSLNSELKLLLKETVLQSYEAMNRRFEVDLYSQALKNSRLDRNLDQNDIRGNILSFGDIPTKIYPQESNLLWENGKKIRDQWQNSIANNFGNDFKSMRTYNYQRRAFTAVLIAGITAGAGYYLSSRAQIPKINTSLDGKNSSSITTPAKAPTTHPTGVQNAIALNKLTDLTPPALPAPVTTSDQEQKIKELNNQLNAVEKDKKENEKEIAEDFKETNKGFEELNKIAKEIKSQQSAIPATQPAKPDLPKEWNTPSNAQGNTASNNDQGNKQTSEKPSAEELEGTKLNPQKITQGQGGNALSGEKGSWVAQVQGENIHYLSSAIYSRIDPQSGRVFANPQDIHLWPLTYQKTDQSVTLHSPGKEFNALVPYGYKIVSVATQNKVTSCKVYYDEANHAWFMKFSADPGDVREGVVWADEGELGPFAPMTLVDSNNQALSEDQKGEIFKADMPAALEGLFERHSHDLLKKRKAILNELENAGLFLYTVNPKIDSGSYGPTHSLLKEEFTYFAGKCDGLCLDTIAMSQALGVDDKNLAEGYAVEGEFITAETKHAWVVRGDGSIDETTSKVGETSPFYGINAGPNEWLKEYEWIVNVRAPHEARRIPKLVKTIEDQEREEALAEEIKKAQDGSVIRNIQEANERVGNYYLSMQDHYDQRLDILRRSSIDRETADVLNKMVVNFDPEKLSLNPTQFEALDHYLRGVINILSAQKLLYARTVDSYNLRIDEFKEFKKNNKDWPKTLSEPLPEPLYLTDTGVVRHPINPISESILNYPSNTNIPIPIHNLEDSIHDDVVYKDKEGEPSDNSNNPESISHFYIRNINGHRYIIDALTNQRTEIPVEYEPVDFMQDLFLLRNRNHYQIAGSRTDHKLNIMLRADWDSVKIFHLPLPNNDWLGFMVNDQGIGKFTGPVAEKEGLLGIQNIHDPKAEMFGGDLLIQYTDKNDGKIYYAGPLARKLGINNTGFAQGEMPVQLSDGKIVMAIRPPKNSRWHLIRNGVPEALKSQEFDELSPKGIKVYSKGRWAAQVTQNHKTRFVGNMDSEILSTSEEISDFLPMETPSGELVCIIGSEVKGYKYIGPWAEDVHLDRFLDALPEGRIVEAHYPTFLDKDGKNFVMKVEVMTDGGLKYFWIGNAPASFMSVLQDRHGLLVDEIISIQSNPDGFWTALVTRPNEKPEHAKGEGPDKIPEYALIFAQSYKEDVEITRVGDYKLFPNGQWVAILNMNDNTHGALFRYLYGPWAQGHNRLYSDNTTSIPIFIKNHGVEDPDQYIYFRQHENGYSATGPIAESLGIIDTIFYKVSAKNLEDGNVKVVIQQTMFSPEIWLTAKPPYPHEEIEASRSGLEDIGSQLHLSRLDRLWENFDQSGANDYYLAAPEAVFSALVKDFDYFHDKIIKKMITDPENRYCNPDEVAKIVHRRSPLIARILIQNTIDDPLRGQQLMADMYQAFNNYGLRYLMLDILKDIRSNLDKSEGLKKDFKFSSLKNNLTNEQWKEITDSYEQVISQRVGMNEELRQASLSPIESNGSPKAKDIINQAVRSVLSPAEQIKLKAYQDALAIVSEVSPQNQEPISAERLGPVIDFLHQRLPNQRLPFDIEENPDAHSVFYQLSRLMMDNAPIFQVGVGNSGGSREFSEWQRINEKLNEAQGSGQIKGRVIGHYSFIDFLTTFRHDSLALAIAVGILAYLLSKVINDRLRQKDIILGKSGKDAFEEAWKTNRWFDGQKQQAYAFTKKLLFGKTITDKDLQYLEIIRPKLSQEESFVVEAVLALASDSPQAVVSARQRLAYLIPALGVFAMLKGPKEFTDRQKMNQEILDALKDKDIKKAWLRIKGIVAKNSSLVEDQDQQEKSGPLSIDDTLKEIDRLSKDPAPVPKIIGPVKITNRPNGSVTKYHGSSSDYAGSREAQPGDDLRYKDKRASARSDRIFIQQFFSVQEINFNLIVNLSELITSAEVKEDFVKSLKELFLKSRERENARGDFYLRHVIMVMPDGTSRPLEIPKHKTTDYHALVRALLAAMKKNIKPEDLKGLQKTRSLAPTFFDNRQRQRYAQRNKQINSLSRNTELFDRKKPSTLSAIFSTKEKNLFAIGFSRPDLEKMRRIFESTEMFVWKENRPKNVKDRAMAAENTGGIDLTAGHMNLETKNPGGEIKFHMDAAMLQQLQNAPGFVPVVINIQPMTNVQEFLGISENKPSKQTATML